MRLDPLIVIAIGTILTQAEGFGIEEFQKGMDAVHQLVRIGVDIMVIIKKVEEKSFDQDSKQLAESFLIEIKAVVEKMDHFMDATIGKPTCPEDAENGVYTLKPGHTTIPPFRVYCEKGGWIVIHRRFNGMLSFDRTWHEYQKGFGDMQDEFWLGLEKLHQLTRTSPFELKVVLKDFGGVEKWSKFDGFRVAGEFEQYRLSLNKFVAGNAGDSIFWHNGMQFSTPDRDNDTDDKHCAERYSSGWWFKQCFDTNLNGLYGEGLSHHRMSWYTFDRKHEGLKETRMMIRPVRECDQKSGSFGSSFWAKY